MTLSDPIRKSVEVPLSPNDAFDLFTEKMGTWWPLDDKSVSAVLVGNGCRVDLIHSGFERYDNGSAVKAGYDQGWGAILGTLYARAAQAMVATV